MNKLGLSSNLVFIKKILGPWFFLGLKVKSRGILIFKVIFYVKNQRNLSGFFSLKNQSYENISIIKDELPFLYSPMKKRQKDSCQFLKYKNEFENQNSSTFDLQNQKELIA